MREALYELVKTLPDRGLGAADKYLTSLRDDPVFLALETAPADDEELTAEERDAVAQGLAEHYRGESVPWEDVRRELGP